MINLFLIVVVSIIVSTFKTLFTRAKTKDNHLYLLLTGTPTNSGFFIIVGMISSLETGIPPILKGVIVGLSYQLGSHIGLLIAQNVERKIL